LDSPHRFFVSDLSAAEVALPAGEAHHARNVLRLPVGQQVEIFDGRGGVAAGRIAQAGKGRVVVAVDSASDSRRTQTRAGPGIHLAFAVPKGKRLDWLLEKATELGAASLRAVAWQRSVAGVPSDQFAGAKRQRWLDQCVAAAKQSGLNWLPAIEPPMGLAEFLAWAGGGRFFGVVGMAEPTARGVADVLMGCPPGKEVCLLVGPEGGMAAEEVEAVLAAVFVPARLGGTVLRVETAAAAMLAVAVAI
jgi:16S rRNA (uracil1498-N3)-methyltransferase